MWRRFWTRLRWLFLGKWPAVTQQLAPLRRLTPLVEAEEVVMRLAPLRAKTQYRVALTVGGATTDVYRGPHGAHARQVYEQVQPRAGETLCFWDGVSCRGEKHG
jgi:hypothetical protein